jgi:phosphotransferase system  glucose/maltose/N-acetylglucosamine-specific IIC component
MVDPFMVALLLTATTFLIGALVSLLVVLVIKNRIRVTTAYLCGESEEDFKNSLSPGSSVLFWGVPYIFRKYYYVVRDKIHTGVLDDWFSLMTPFLVILPIILAALAAWGWIK